MVSVHVPIQRLVSGAGFVAELADKVPRAHVTFHVPLEITFGEKFRLAVDAVKLLHSRVPLHMKAQLALLSNTSSTQNTEMSSSVKMHG